MSKDVKWVEVQLGAGVSSFLGRHVIRCQLLGERIGFVVRATRLPSDRLALRIGVGQQQASGTAQRLPSPRPVRLTALDAQEW
jgi:hypothetical protein